MTHHARILVVEDDPCALLLISHILRQLPEYACTFTRSSEEAADLLATAPWDLLITDLQMPGRDGLALAALARDKDPQLPVLLVTAHPTIDVAVQAVRSAVTDFLVKPLGDQQVRAAVATALATRRRRVSRVLAIGAHPDDVEIGAGATLAQHAARGDEVTILTASRGNVGGDADRRAQEIETLDAFDAAWAALESVDKRLLALAVASFLFVLCCLSLGLIISSRAPSLETANFLGLMVAFLPGFMLSGFAFPLNSIPVVLQWMSYLFPARYMTVVARAVFLKGAGLDVLWPEVTALGAYALIGLTLASLLWSRRAD